ncbi:hypothetical protein CK203_099343 [Vitis vinifera]|uniref:Uncharacterized protein n=1 Tax=Vitis vinifera TaxID=29760 RepID=A0A438DF06_VITVI|nr:hypothetical protein CK203_099343 [Vitis vinifera]
MDILIQNSKVTRGAENLNCIGSNGLSQSGHVGIDVVLFPLEWERPKPGRRPDIFPQFSPMKTPLPLPLPADPPEEDEEEEEKKEEEEEDPEKEEPDNPEKPASFGV